MADHTKTTKITNYHNGPRSHDKGMRFGFPFDGDQKDDDAFLSLSLNHDDCVGSVGHVKSRKRYRKIPDGQISAPVQPRNREFKSNTPRQGTHLGRLRGYLFK